MSEKSSSKSSGISAIGLLGVVFVTLKLLGVSAVAEWSWWWVLAPFWGGLALFFAILVMAVVWQVSGMLIDSIRRK